MSTQISKGPHS